MIEWQKNVLGGASALLVLAALAAASGAAHWDSAALITLGVAIVWREIHRARQPARGPVNPLQGYAPRRADSGRRWSPVRALMRRR